MYDTIHSNKLIFNLDEDGLRCIIEESVINALQKMHPMPVEDTLLTRKDVAKLLKVSLVTLNQWVKEGRIPQQKIKSRVYFKQSEVMNALHKTEMRYGKNR